MSKNLITEKIEPPEAGKMERRGFLRFSMIAGINLILALIIPFSACGWRARARRRVRRTTRRRVRRNVAWRTVAGRRALVVPANIEPGDVLVLDDGRAGTVTAVHSDTVVLSFSGTEQTVVAVFEGGI